jgi:hypothetical protein
VAFASYADGLVRTDTNHWRDLFVRDRRTRLTRRVDVSSYQPRSAVLLTVGDPALSSNGRFVAFSAPGDLLRGQSGDHQDVFVRGPLRWR